MRVTFLGTGTSVGVPVITCDCDVCASDDPRNKRLRAGLLLEWDDGGGEPVRVLVDTTTDLRQQALRVALPRVDAVIYTHHHADHILGLDELRIYNFIHRVAIPLYGRQETIDAIKRTFAYAFDVEARGVPRLELHRAEEPFALRGVRVVPVPVEHDRLTISAYRIGNFAYITDCSGIAAESAELLRGVEVLVIDALRRKPHPAHFTLDEALAEIERLGPSTAYLTHLSHEFDHRELQTELPPGVNVAYDGLVLDVDEQAA
jgi:phosphoribosyl 1,2-cyclic phosphate phosphodiesterase